MFNENMIHENLFRTEKDFRTKNDPLLEEKSLSKNKTTTRQEKCTAEQPGFSAGFSECQSFLQVQISSGIVLYGRDKADPSIPGGYTPRKRSNYTLFLVLRD